MLKARERVIVALDVSTLDEAERIVREIGSEVGMFKAGLELITNEGTPRVAQFFRELNLPFFLDNKFGDIPTTVGRAAQAAARHGAYAFNVHASAGIDAMFAGYDNRGASRLWAVTVLTSVEPVECELLHGASPAAKVLQWARNAKLAGVDGIICSPQELVMLKRRRELAGLEYITPGIRPDWAAVNDQKRITTPFQAIRDGAAYIVVGRPITDPPGGMSRTQAARKVAEEVGEALAA